MEAYKKASYKSCWDRRPTVKTVCYLCDGFLDKNARDFFSTDILGSTAAGPEAAP